MSLHDEIRKTAYELFEREGRIHGRDVDHWVEAERIVAGRNNRQEVAVQKTAPGKSSKASSVKRPARESDPGKARSKAGTTCTRKRQE